MHHFDLLAYTSPVVQGGAMTPEQEARQRIDARFAVAGWAVRSGNAYPTARRGLLWVDRSAVGAWVARFHSQRPITAFVCERAVAVVSRAA